jgi:hypothetical protein
MRIQSNLTTLCLACVLGIPGSLIIVSLASGQCPHDTPFFDWCPGATGNAKCSVFTKVGEEDCDDHEWKDVRKGFFTAIPKDNHAAVPYEQRDCVVSWKCEWSTNSMACVQSEDWNPYNLVTKGTYSEVKCKKGE